MLRWSIELPSPTATLQFGKCLAEQLSPGTILLLKGTLGAGKTTLIQGLGLGLAIDSAIISPTFSLIQEYPEGRIPLYHLDLYRLDPHEVDDLYLDNYFEGIDVPLGITAIEWSERLLEIPPQYLSLELVITPEDTRRITLEAINYNPNLDFSHGQDFLVE